LLPENQILGVRGRTKTVTIIKKLGEWLGEVARKNKDKDLIYAVWCNGNMARL
jgi:hypothetical protein